MSGISGISNSAASARNIGDAAGEGLATNRLAESASDVNAGLQLERGNEGVQETGDLTRSSIANTAAKEEMGRAASDAKAREDFKTAMQQLENAALKTAADLIKSAC
jgi:hypothetical protein